MANLVDKFQWGQTLTVDTDPDSTHTITAHVYALIHPDDGVIYAGSTRSPVEDREGLHKRSFVEHMRNTGVKSTPLTRHVARQPTGYADAITIRSYRSVTYDRSTHPDDMPLLMEEAHAIRLFRILF